MSTAAGTLEIESLVVPFQKQVNDAEHYDRKLLMSHLCAYQLAGKLGSGSRLLEVGSGSGYGAYYLSHIAEEVTAIDMDSAVVATAQKLFIRPNLRYIQQNGVKLPFENNRFSCAGAFQVIEHIPEPDLPNFVKELHRVLAPGGICVISTLNLDHNRKNSRYEKPSFHEKEFTAPELKSLLASIFPHVTLYGLYPGLRHRLFRRLKRWGLHRFWREGNPVQRFFDAELCTKDFVMRGRVTNAAIDLIAICGK